MRKLEIIKCRFILFLLKLKLFCVWLLFYTLDMEHNNPAYTISAALCYATQLVNILSHILDVNLPKKLCNRQVLEGGDVFFVMDLSCSCCVLIYSD